MQDNPDLDPLLRNSDGTVRRLNLSFSDEQDLVNFLNTLTDNVFLNDPKFADAF